jgi:predicted nucleic acid-binding protein
LGSIIALDANVLSIAARAKGTQDRDDLWQLLSTKRAVGVWFIIPEIADYEVRRWLHATRAQAGLRRLNDMKSQFVYYPITTTHMQKAAELWGNLRRRGLPVSGSRDLGADVILAARALTFARPGDLVTIATGNVDHLSRFPGIDAKDWKAIS